MVSCQLLLGLSLSLTDFVACYGILNVVTVEAHMQQSVAALRLPSIAQTGLLYVGLL